MKFELKNSDLEGLKNKKPEFDRAVRIKTD